MNRRHLLTALLASAAVPLEAAQPLSIVTTTGMIADATRLIGGEHVDVRALMGPGVDPHAYRQTRSDILAMTRADAVFWHGLYLEAQMEDFFADLSRRLPVTAIADNLPHKDMIAHEDYAGRFDPHVWMDTDLWSLCAGAIKDALSQLRPEAAGTFDANLVQFQASAEALGSYAQEVLRAVPQDQRVLVTAHDAFGYFGRTYGYEVMGIQGISTDSEAGLNRISELVDVIVSRKIRAVFVETSVSDRNVKALIEGAAAQGHDVKIGGALFSDAMGPAGTYEGTWLGMIDHNVTTIASALGADVPYRGRLGRLGS